MITDLNIIREIAAKKESENIEFHSFLKSLDMNIEEIDAIVHEIYREVSAKIDCKTCANCCKEDPAVLNEEEVKKFAKMLKNTSVDQFIDLYLIKDKESDEYFVKEKPCPFLKNNLCEYYTHRPKDCQAYPYLDKKKFVFQLEDVIDNYSICPVVFNVYEILKQKLWCKNHFNS